MPDVSSILNHVARKGIEMNDVRQTIAANIKSFRKAKGLSVDAVGEALGKSGKTISAWEVGRGQPDADETVVLCRVLGIDLLDLYGKQEQRDEREERLVAIYRSLSDEGKTALMASAEGIVSAYREGENDGI